MFTNNNNLSAVPLSGARDSDASRRDAARPGPDDGIAERDRVKFAGREKKTEGDRGLFCRVRSLLALSTFTEHSCSDKRLNA